MDTLSLELKGIEGGGELTLEGIPFSRCAFVRVLVNKNFDSLNAFSDSLTVFSELERSSTGSGRYLIFTCACGVADDGGWDYVDVVHHGSAISWKFSRGQEYSFIFHENSYRETIAKCAHRIDSLDSGTLLEPTSFVYPEE